jgi:hypothetical protein
MTDLATPRGDLRAFSLAIEQPLAEWQAESLSLERRTTAIPLHEAAIAPRRFSSAQAQ